ncbi:MAG: isochorismate synthase [Chloroflexi bacterium]|nr:isochorismate synthase [Chloroflexota bacterium]
MTTAIMAPALRDTVSSLLSRVRKTAKSCNHPVLASLARPLSERVSPLAVFAAGRQRVARRTLWGRPGQDFWLVGKGNAARWHASGDTAMVNVAGNYHSLLESAVIEVPDVCGVGPVALGGFRYDTQTRRDALWEDFPDALFVLPRFLFTWTGSARWLTINVIVEPEGDARTQAEAIMAEMEDVNRDQPDQPNPPAIRYASESSREEWAQRVRQALLSIESGALSKVVLARRKMLYAQGQFCLDNALDKLSRSYPSCTVFAIDSGKTAFFGATPESLSRVRKGRLSLTCLAGSGARGDTPEEDFRLQNELLESPKERFEHAAVVTTVTAALKDLCREMDRDAVPRVLKLKNVQHLLTSVTGCLHPGNSILDVAGRLHPTPAVAGVPTARALEFIRETEGDRGWYAAPVGWMDHTGSGEFAVAIRSALLNGDRATLFAGCGIVQASDADQEFCETEMKFQPLREALSGS